MRDFTNKITHLEPTHIEEELQQGEDGQVEVQVVTRVTLGGVEELPTNQTSQKETVHSHGYNLSESTGHLQTV